MVYVICLLDVDPIHDADTGNFKRHFYQCGVGKIRGILLITQELEHEFLSQFFERRNVSLAINHLIAMLIRITTRIQKFIKHNFTTTGPVVRILRISCFSNGLRSLGASNCKFRSRAIRISISLNTFIFVFPKLPK